MWQLYMGADENDHGALMKLNHVGIRPDACRSSKGQKMVSFACLFKELKKKKCENLDKPCPKPNIMTLWARSDID